MFCGRAAVLFRQYRMRRWGKRGSVLVKLHRPGWRTPLPIIHLVNLSSLPNKTDELLLVSRFKQECFKLYCSVFHKNLAERCHSSGEIAWRWNVLLHQREVVKRCNSVKEDMLFWSRNALHQLQAILLAARVLFINSCEGSSSLPVIQLQCGKVWKTSPVTRHHPQHYGESTTGRRSEWVLL